MATVTKVTVSFSAKIPTQQYANIEIGGHWTAELDESDSPEDVSRDLFGRVKAEITAALTPIAKAKMDSAYHLLNGLPANAKKEFMGQWGVVEFLQMANPELNISKAADRATGLEAELAAQELVNAELRAELAELRAKLPQDEAPEPEDKARSEAEVPAAPTEPEDAPKPKRSTKNPFDEVIEEKKES